VSFDVNEDGSINEEDDGRIRVGSDHEQFFLLRTRVTNCGDAGDLDEVVFWDGLREHFVFDARYEDLSDDGSEDDICADGMCDGVGEDPSGACPIELSGLPQKKGESELRSVVISPEDGFAADETCETRLYLKTKEAETKGKNTKKPQVFEPSECTFSGTFSGGQVANPIPINEGVDTINEVDELKLAGPIGTRHAYPVCP
jgi:hypothetical protein